MSKYLVVLKTTAFAYIKVEAESEDEAEEAAAGEAPRLCAACSGWDRDFSLTLNDEWETDVVETIPTT